MSSKDMVKLIQTTQLSETQSGCVVTGFLNFTLSSNAESLSKLWRWIWTHSTFSFSKSSLLF